MITNVLILVLLISIALNAYFFLKFTKCKRQVSFLKHQRNMRNILLDILESQLQALEEMFVELKDKNKNCNSEKSVTVLDENGVFLSKYKSIRKASKELGISRKTIREHAKTGKKYKNYIFKFI